jgi:hypothetical protein
MLWWLIAGCNRGISLNPTKAQKGKTVENGTHDGWIKAAASAQGGNCVEMRRGTSGVEVRNSKHPDGHVLHFTDAEFAAWLDGARKGEFAHLLG